MSNLVDKSYTRFASAVAVVLLLGTAAVVVMATISFLRLTLDVAMLEGADIPYSSLQRLFDLLLGAVIALELAHSVHLMIRGDQVYAQVRAVLVIGILAVVRKLIVIELDAVSGVLLLGLAAAVIALGGAFALMIWVERRSRADDRDT